MDEITERRREELEKAIGKKVSRIGLIEYFSFFRRHSIITFYFDDGSSIELKS
jgi:hypothetical protein